MTTILYILVGWVALNVLFAAGMYFRPVRKLASTSSELERSDAGEGLTRKRSDVPAAIGSSTAVGKVLLFGLWLGDRQHLV
ncbi:hypothetical protein ACFFWD_37570 [Bradyrhizobium erythrophlei]|uniref:hypothetical protein n=1 Tax=Bradyrhizobium erythrophlei TaxID=1437360 RepID=UPI0035EFD180